MQPGFGLALQLQCRLRVLLGLFTRSQSPINTSYAQVLSVAYKANQKGSSSPGQWVAVFGRVE